MEGMTKSEEMEAESFAKSQGSTVMLATSQLFHHSRRGWNGKFMDRIHGQEE
jgi:hypothetical protein